MHATSDEFVWVLNVQQSDDGIHFYINLGAHPRVLLHEGQAAFVLKEAQCAFRTRVGERWLREPLSDEVVPLFSHTESSFRAEIQSGVQRLLTGAPEEAVVCGYGAKHHFLVFAQICAAYGRRDQALRFLDWGGPQVRRSATGLLQQIELFRRRLESAYLG